jgi:hypothetical protein
MAARGVQGLIAVSALIGLTACGSAMTGSAGHATSAPASARSSGTSAPASASSSGASTAAAGTPAGGSLCADDQGVDRVEVSRTSSSRQVTVSGATQVRALATALCALPLMPSGQSCTAASGESVRLVFADGAQGFPPVSIQESGCRGVTGAGPTRSWSASSPFGQMLSEAAGGLGRLVPGMHPSSVPIGP